MDKNKKIVSNKETDDSTEGVNWPVILPILGILLAAVIYAFFFT